MNLTRTFFTIIVIILFSCKSKKEEGKPEVQHIPEAMQGGNEYSYSKRGGDDPVNSIYENLLKKSEGLSAMDQKVDGLSEEQSDSTQSVHKYLQQSDNYYYTAQRNLQAISDSQLRMEVLGLLDKSQVRFGENSAGYKKLLSLVGSNVELSRGRREAIKILLTLPVIEEYQRNNRPDTKPSENLLHELDKLKAWQDSVINRSKG